MLGDDLKIDVEGALHVLLYQDAALPTVFYCASTRPAVARIGGEYQLMLVHYDRPLDDQVGMLSLVIDLRPDAQEMTVVRAELLARCGGAPFELHPIPWTAGTVAVALVGGAPVFSTPSLIGDNAAAVSLGLNLTQYLLLRNADPTSAVLPLSVVYGLSFEAFRRKFDFSVQFDASKFRSWVQKKCSADFLFISVERTDTFEELRNEGVIRVESENLTDEEPPEGFKQAFLHSLKSILVPLPQFAPAPRADTGSGGWSIGFSCSAVRDVQDIAKRLDTRMQVSGVVARKVYIQGGLDGLQAALRARPDVELATGMSFTRTLTVRCHDAFGGEPLSALSVSIPELLVSPASHEFKDPGDAWPVELVHPPGEDTGCHYKCRLYFPDRPAVATPPVAIRREWAYLDIVPSALYTWRRYAVSVDAEFPWSLIRSITLSLQVPAGLEVRPATLTLVQATATGSIEVFAPHPVDLDAVTVSATYTPVTGGGAPFTLTNLPAGNSIFLNPFIRRTVTFRVADSFDWQRTSAIAITVAVAADNPQLWESRKFALTSAAPRIRVTCWYVLDRKVGYRAAFKMGARESSTGPVTTLQSEVVLSAPQEAIST